LRVLALDVGERRIGVALSDPLKMLATPLATVNRVNEPDDLREISRLVDDNEVSEIVVGLPLSMSGRKGDQARLVEKFSKVLAEAVDVPIRLVDERLSSVQAERFISDSGGRPSENRARVDATAAAIILQAYLDSKG
jgi:putative Holliday junction resolvase